MLKNFNDYISLITLIVFSIAGLGIFISIFTNKENVIRKDFNLIYEMYHYLDNTEE